MNNNKDYRKGWSAGWYSGYIVSTILYIIISIILAGLQAKADSSLEALIALQAREQGVPVQVAIAVAKVESRLNQSAIGPFGEVGVFQIRPEYTTANIYDLKTNIHEGVRQLAYWQAHCPVRLGYSWVSCYNAGKRHPKYPFLLPYVKKVLAEL
jgi:soluble lytic murein transglycosylase-like protein